MPEVVKVRRDIPASAPAPVSVAEVLKVRLLEPEIAPDGAAPPNSKSSDIGYYIQPAKTPSPLPAPDHDNSTLPPPRTEFGVDTIAPLYPSSALSAS